MSTVKERILGAITVMDETDAAVVWNFIASTFSKRTWDDIEEEDPDEWDQKMLREIEGNPECHEFIPAAEAMKRLGL